MTPLNALNDQELATILAALRRYQDEGMPQTIHHTDHAPLTAEEIDQLCERLNTTVPPTRALPGKPVEEAEEGIDPFTVLEIIQQRLDGVEWTPETLNLIADDLRTAGYPVRDSGEEA